MLLCLTVKLFYPFDGITLYYFSQVGGKMTFRELTEVARKPQAIKIQCSDVLCICNRHEGGRKHPSSSEGLEIQCTNGK